MRQPPRASRYDAASFSMPGLAAGGFVRLIHECIEDPVILASALNAAHAHVPMLATACATLQAEVARRHGLTTNAAPLRGV